MKIEISEDDFRTLCICAIRYCYGRRTYIPGVVQEICSEHLEEFSDKDFLIMFNDYDFHERMCLYLDEIIDKPRWLKWKKTLLEEKERRGV